MKGSNRLNLNHETMCAALQVWIDQTFASAIKPKVTKVEKENSTGTYGADAGFSVTVEAVETKVVAT